MVNPMPTKAPGTCTLAFLQYYLIFVMRRFHTCTAIRMHGTCALKASPAHISVLQILRHEEAN